MRLTRLTFVAIASLYAFSAAAQGWIEFIDEQEMFGINLPQVPTAEEITYHTEYHAELPGKVYTAADQNVIYKISVINYGQTHLAGERALWDFHGSVAYAATNIRKRGGDIIHDGWAQADRIPGHQLAVINPDGTRSYFQIHSHGTRLYVAEAIASADVTPPIHFQQSLIILDDAGEIVRYDTDLRTRVDAGR